jgi:LPS-assembly lipoprotein
MWWHDKTAAPVGQRARTVSVRMSGAFRFARIGVALAAAGLLAACFQPLYGEHSITGTGSNLHDQLSAVDVKQIDAPNGTPEARIGVELRDKLLFNLTGGSSAAPPTHRLTVRLSSTRISVIVDINSGRPDLENYGLDASFSLTEIATGKVVLTSQTSTRVSYDIPGSEQRFARVRALRDSENRAAGVVADQIRTRLASYFVAGT